MTGQELIEQLQAMKDRGDVHGEVNVLQQMLTLAQQTHNQVGEVEVLRWLGNAFQKLSQMQTAHSYRVTAAQLVEKLGAACPDNTRMLVEGDLGRSFIEVHDWTRAEEHTRRALQIAEQRQDEQPLCIYWMNLAVVLNQTRRKAEAHRLA